MFRLPYAQKSFEVVIVSNALHIVPHPEKALQEIRRVLKDDGVLIAPTFTHAGNSVSGKAKAFFMSMRDSPSTAGGQARNTCASYVKTAGQCIKARC